VLAADPVPDRLARPCVAHRGREGRKDDASLRVVVLEQDAVALDARCGRHVVRLRVADQRMDQETVDGLERALGQVLVRAVDWVTGLETDDPLPATVGKGRSGLRGIEGELRKGRLRALEDRHLAGEVERLLRVEPRDARMSLVRGPKRVPGLA